MGPAARMRGVLLCGAWTENEVSIKRNSRNTNAWATHPGLHTRSGKPAKPASHPLASLGAKVGEVAPLHPFHTGQADFLGRGSEQFTPNGPELQRGLVWSLSNQATRGPNPPTMSPREAALPDASSRLNALRRVIHVLDPHNCGAPWAPLSVPEPKLSHSSRPRAHHVRHNGASFQFSKGSRHTRLCVC